VDAEQLPVPSAPANTPTSFAAATWNGSGERPRVARRAGHSVDVRLWVCAKCVDGQAATVNHRIDVALGDWT